MGQWGAGQPLVWPDVEEQVVIQLAALMADAGETVTVGLGVPEAWTSASTPHLTVAWDGTPRTVGAVLAVSTVRLVARAATTGEAKRLAALAQALIVNDPGDGVATVSPLTGVLPARDGATRAELAAVTCRVVTRSAAALTAPSV